MPVAAIAKTTARVLWLIGARDTAAAFNTTVGNDNFILEEIQRALIETEMEIAQDLADSRHPMRNTFLAWSSDLSHGDLIPAHLGEVEAVQIKYYSAALDYNPAEATTRENIRLWRENYNNAFDAINHNANGSNLSGYYNITGDTIFFTGHRAQAKVFTFTPDFAAHQIDAVFEPALVAGTIPRLLKIGVPMGLAQHYGQQYANMRQLIRTGHVQMPDVQEIQKAE